MKLKDFIIGIGSVLDLSGTYFSNKYSELKSDKDVIKEK